MWLSRPLIRVTALQHALANSHRPKSEPESDFITNNFQTPHILQEPTLTGHPLLPFDLAKDDVQRPMIEMGKGAYSGQAKASEGFQWTDKVPVDWKSFAVNQHVACNASVSTANLFGRVCSPRPCILGNHASAHQMAGFFQMRQK